MRRFIFSSSVLSAVFGGLGALRTTLNGPRDWRLILMWVAWACTVGVALGTVAKENPKYDRTLFDAGKSR